MSPAAAGRKALPYQVNSMELKKKAYRYDEVAMLLSVSSRTVGRLVEEGKLTRIFLGGSTRSARITARSIEEFVERKELENGSILHPP